MKKVLLIGLDLLAVTTLVAVGLLLYYGRQEPADLALAQVRASGLLRVATDATYPPFESYTDGAYSGYDIDLAKLIGARLGVAVAFSNIPSDSLYQALGEGKVDAIVSALPFIYERSNDLIYSRAYFNAAPLLVVPAASTARSLSDIAAGKLGAQLGSDSDEAARRWQRDHPTGGLQLATFDTPTAALDALAAGQVAAALADPLEFTAWQVAHPAYKAVANLGEAGYVVAVGKQSRQLARLVDETIANAQADGTLARLAARWFVATPNPGR